VSANENLGKYYEIVVKGQLEPGWGQWFNDLEIQNKLNGEAILSGIVAEQAALHGLFIKK
jgi:hypothetical protein